MMPSSSSLPPTAPSLHRDSFKSDLESIRVFFAESTCVFQLRVIKLLHQIVSATGTANGFDFSWLNEAKDEIEATRRASPSTDPKTNPHPCSKCPK